MIFLDESGKRWKRIKHSTSGLILAGTLPFGALVVGSVAFQPSWGLIPLVKQASGSVLADSVISQLTANKPTSTQSAPTAQAAARKQAQKEALRLSNTGTPSPSATATPAASVKPAATTLPLQAKPPLTASSPISPSTSPPNQNYYGQSHKPAK